MEGGAYSFIRCPIVDGAFREQAVNEFRERSNLD